MASQLRRVERQSAMLGCHSNMSTGAAARESGAAAEIAASCNEVLFLAGSGNLILYADLDGRYIFEAIAIDALGVLNTSARQLLCDLGRKISEHTGKSEKRAFCFKVLDARATFQCHITSRQFTCL